MNAFCRIILGRVLINPETLFDVRYAPDSRLKADIPGSPRRATFGLMRRSKELVRFVPFVKTGCYEQYYTGAAGIIGST